MLGSGSEKFRERGKREGKTTRIGERERKSKNPRLPEIVFYVTWPAADVIASDWT